MSDAAWRHGRTLPDWNATAQVISSALVGVSP
jgi:hypothetical protein